MGFLWTTEGTRRVLDTLNNAFDATGLAYIRGKVEADSQLAQYIRDRLWLPARLAWVLKLMPVDQPSGEHGVGMGTTRRRHRKRWHWFLQDMASKSPATFTAIQNALSDGILTKDAQGRYVISRISYDQVELPQGSAIDVVIFDLPVSGGMVRHITLFTPAVPEKDQHGNPFDGTDFIPPDDAPAGNEPPQVTNPDPPWRYVLAPF